MLVNVDPAISTTREYYEYHEQPSSVSSFSPCQKYIFTSLILGMLATNALLILLTLSLFQTSQQLQPVLHTLQQYIDIVKDHSPEVTTYSHRLESLIDRACLMGWCNLTLSSRV